VLQTVSVNLPDAGNGKWFDNQSQCKSPDATYSILYILNQLTAISLVT